MSDEFISQSIPFQKVIGQKVESTRREKSEDVREDVDKRREDESVG
jgi:hypothetical protein